MNHQSETSGGQTINLFLSRPDSVENESLFEKYHALLDEEERARCSRYRFVADRRAFLLAHALVRVALSKFAGVPPQALRFRPNRYGRPEIDPPAPLRFSLSHTRGLVACAVGRELEVGIDVEKARVSIDPIALADRFYARHEATALRALPIEQQMDQFLSIWTLKEAYAKARGSGLSLPLDEVAFRIDGGVIEMSLENAAPEDRSAWWFGLMRPLAGYWLGLAARPLACLPRLDTRWLIPLTTLSQATELPVAATTRSASTERKES